MRWIALALALAAACRPDPASPAAQTPAPGRVVARANGLPVSYADLVDGIRSGHLGGAPVLVLDELESFALVNRECEVMLGQAACAGFGGTRERAERFLALQFPPARLCGTVTADDYDAMYGRVARRIPPGTDRRAPEARLAVEGAICQARARQVQRAYIQALRKDARVEVDQDAVKEAVAEAEAGK